MKIENFEEFKELSEVKEIIKKSNIAGGNIDAKDLWNYIQLLENNEVNNMVEQDIERLKRGFVRRNDGVYVRYNKYRAYLPDGRCRKILPLRKQDPESLELGLLEVSGGELIDPSEADIE